MTIYFTPTYLYIKQHTITGKLYFGKTIQNPETYLGSGKHWKLHIEKHGKEHVINLWYCLFHNAVELESFALECSKAWNIVESDTWLNLKYENGTSGGSIKGFSTGHTKRKKRTLTEEHKRKIGEGRKNKLHSPETLLKMKKPKSLEHRLKMSESAKNRTRSTSVSNSPHLSCQ